MHEAPGIADGAGERVGKGTIPWLALQLLLTLAVLAWLPGNLVKLVALLAVWIATFRRWTAREFFIYVVVCLLFSVMDVMAVRQGVFRFVAPDFLGLPAWEFFMWGFFVLHALRVLRGPAPNGALRTALLVGVGCAVPFVTIAEPWLLFAVSAAMLAFALCFFHDTWDFTYVGYMVALGALVEYAGVWSGQWEYPAAPPGGVPFWFVTMWGGVGLFTRRLALPLLRPPQ